MILIYSVRVYPTFSGKIIKYIYQWPCYLGYLPIPDMIAVVALVVTKFLLDWVPIRGLSIARGTAGFLLSLSGYLKSLSMAKNTIPICELRTRTLLSGRVRSFFLK